jgi:hypothetical protein
MKRITVLLVLSFVLFTLTYGKQVDEMTAKTVGKNFISNRVSSTSLKAATDLQLVYTARSKDILHQGSTEPEPCFYVFNINSSKGFVIVSAEDNVVPVLAYSDESGFNSENIPPDVSYWLNGYREQIEEARSKSMQATDEIRSKWEALQSGTGSYLLYKPVAAVAPLEQTTWNQSPDYNAMCPFDNTYNELTVTGCVATAMAQIMKFWNSPTNGAGFHSYNDPKYGTQSANFGSTTYDWANMPNSISGPNSAIATLMYHCGVSVDMTYGVGATGGSAAYVISSQSPIQACAEYAYKIYFGYPDVQGKDRSAYPNKGDWQQLLKTDLDAGRPVLYAGFGSGGGHCFNCDGYDANNMFHFNWGWGGAYDGYFDVDALNPEGTGTGGGTGGFNSGQQCVVGIQGPNGGGGGGGGGGQSSTLDLWDFVVPNPSDIEYGSSFDVHTDIANMTSTDFSGYYCAAIFDNDGAFVDYVEVLSGQTLPAGYHYTNGITFTNSGLLTMLPGTYYVGIFYAHEGDSLWIQVSDTLTYQNLVQMTVHHANQIELYSNMTVTPGLTLVQGQAASVHLDIWNSGTTDFNGTYDVSLYDLDGYAVATIGQMTGQSLPAGYHYTNGLDFSTANLNCAEGTYLLAMQYLPDGSQSWQLTGSTDYLNPIAVEVQRAPYGNDLWEPNNTVPTSSSLPVTFTGNTATISTPGANISSTSSSADYDYYKIDLPAGYSYMVGGRLNDSKSSGNGQTYTVDAIVSYSTDGGGTFSNTYDDVMPGIVSASGGTMYFLVSPKFTGKSGSYSLDLTVTRNPLGINDLSADMIKIYPNPVKDFIILDLTAFKGTFSQIQVLNTQGQQVMQMNNVEGNQSLKVQLDNLTDGIYFLQLQTENGMISKKFIVRK